MSTEVQQEVETRLVGPVKVLEQQDEGSLRAEIAQELLDRPEDLESRIFSVYTRRYAEGVGSESLEKWKIRGAAVLLEAPAHKASQTQAGGMCEHLTRE